LAPDKPANTYQWHPQFHSDIAGEKLVYVFVAFSPIYDRHAVLAETDSVFKSLAIRSYSLWEIFGNYDLIIQAWLPRRLTSGKLLSELENRLHARNISVNRIALQVEEYIHHWMWPEIDDVEELDGKVTPEDYYNLNYAPVPDERVSEYSELGIIHEPFSIEAMKVFIRITAPNVPTNQATERQMIDAIKGLFRPDDHLETDDEDDRESGRILSHGVIMKVSGEGPYLVSGRLQHKDFERLLGSRFEQRSGSATQNLDSLVRALGCRTITYISAQYTPLARVEQLKPFPTAGASRPARAPAPLLPSANNLDINRLLRENESEQLEFKASAFTDVDRKVGRPGEQRTRADQVYQIAKAVVGMLNADGGTIILGVAELAKYDEPELRGVYPNGHVVERLFCIGVESEFPRNSWDGYHLRLLQDLRNSIEPPIDGWIRLVEEHVESVTLCVISVQHPTENFYVKQPSGKPSVFYGRTGSETRPLSGHLMDAFKRAHPRARRAAR
jgi:hypothetical protein